jgi:signal peptidase I
VVRPVPVPAAKRAFRHEIAEWAVTLVMMLFLTAMIAQPYVIPSGSMENNLLPGDHVIADKLVYAPSGPVSRHLLPYAGVKRGDIVCFQWPEDIKQTFVKRIIGVPGDRIRIAGKNLFLNGKAVNEPYVVHKTDFLIDYRDNFPGPVPLPEVTEAGRRMLAQHVKDGELIVPPGQYFALGDNRDLSLDSRFWGFVPRENITGKPVLVWWSYDAPREELERPGISLDHAIDLTLHLFTKTRWDRTLMLVRGYPLE